MGHTESVLAMLLVHHVHFDWHLSVQHLGKGCGGVVAGVQQDHDVVEAGVVHDLVVGIGAQRPAST